MNQKIKRNILLNPGPATTTDSVKYAQVVPDICPRENEFGVMMHIISNELTNLVATTDFYTTVLFGGSGTAAVEAILSSVIPSDGVILIINNGAYGQRMLQMALIYGLGVVEYVSPITEKIDLVHLENVIQNGPKLTHLAVVHNETTTGLLNPIKEIGEICQKYDIKLIVDGMSSFAAIPISMADFNIHYLAASANKNLQGIAGVSFVIANKASLEQTQFIPAKGLYLNLYHQYDHFCKTLQMQFTPPVQTMYALKQAIEETKQEGIANRYERYCQLWQAISTGMITLGFTMPVAIANQSKIITTFNDLDDPLFSFESMHDYLYERGFTIYPGKIGKMGTFRIANIGDIHLEDIELFLQTIKNYLKTM